MKRLLLALIGLAFLASPASAESGIRLGEADASPLQPPRTAGSGLGGVLDAARVDFRHTVGIRFGTGSSGFSQYYLNTMTFEPDRKLTLQATLGVQNRVGAESPFGRDVSGARILIPHVGLLYRPTESLRISIAFSNVPQARTFHTWRRAGF